jgi:hypothetical protein
MTQPSIDRQKLFNLSSYIVFESSVEFEAAWAYADNVWVKLRGDKKTKAGKTTTSYRCRLTYSHAQRNKFQKADKEGDVSTSRAKGSQVGVACPARIQVVKFANGKVEVRPQKGHTGCHCHTIDVVDEAKLVGAVRSFIASEAEKAYTPAAIKDATKQMFVDATTHQPLFGIQHLEGVHVRNIINKSRKNGDKLMLKGSGDAEIDLTVAQQWLTDNQYDASVVRATQNSTGLVFMNDEMKNVLRTCGTWVQMDATHCTNSFNWYLFTLYARDNYGSWVPGGHFLTNVQNGEIVGECLKQICKFCPSWKPSGFLVDDSKIEKAGIKNAFWRVHQSQMDVKIFNCTVHTMRAFKRRFSSDNNKTICRKMNAALYSKTKIGCEERIKEAIRLTNDDQVKNYLSNCAAHSHEWSL